MRIAYNSAIRGVRTLITQDVIWAVQCKFLSHSFFYHTIDCQPRTGKKKRGRERRWRDVIRVFAETTWTRTAQNRNE